MLEIQRTIIRLSNGWKKVSIEILALEDFIPNYFITRLDFTPMDFIPNFDFIPKDFIPSMDFIPKYLIPTLRSPIVVLARLFIQHSFYTMNALIGN